MDWFSTTRIQVLGFQRRGSPLEFKTPSWEWLFFQNVNLVQRHGSNNPIVLYQQISLQISLQVCVLFIAETMQLFTGDVCMQMSLQVCVSFIAETMQRFTG